MHIKRALWKCWYNNSLFVRIVDKVQFWHDKAKDAKHLHDTILSSLLSSIAWKQRANFPTKRKCNKKKNKIC